MLTHAETRFVQRKITQNSCFGAIAAASKIFYGYGAYCVVVTEHNFND